MRGPGRASDLARNRRWCRLDELLRKSGVRGVMGGGEAVPWVEGLQPADRPEREEGQLREI